MIPRRLEDIITRRMFQGKAIIVTGPRQVGKTTLVRQIAHSTEHRWFNGDEPDTREYFSKATSTSLKALVGSATLVIIDEAQRIENIGLAVKLLIDSTPEIQVIVTGSSALELADSFQEPLTGRKFDYHLFPLSCQEMAGCTTPTDEHRLIEHRMIFGYYPDVVLNQGNERELLMNLCNSYLYKDLLALQQVRKPVLLDKLLQALALQLGNEVSFHELGQLVGTDGQTIERYVDLLERTFVVFRIPSLSRNMRNEIKKGRKIYFYDTGIRNALIKNFNPLALRQDTGPLWENFCVVERMKANQYDLRFVNRFFWRTVQQQEIDYIEEYDGIMHAFEFKWNPRKKTRLPQSFSTAYPDSRSALISPENFEEFVAPP